MTQNYVPKFRLRRDNFGFCQNDHDCDDDDDNDDDDSIREQYINVRSCLPETVPQS